MVNTTFQFDCFGISDIGLVREQNEDVWAAFPEIGLFLLADGMGGHASGEVAAKETVDHLSLLVNEWNPSEDITLEMGLAFFREALQKVNTHVYLMGQASDTLRGMGTTICVLYFLQKHVLLAHVGDSRIYRQSSSGLEQLTEDHSLVSELVAMGAMKPEDAETFPYKHILTRAIGTQPSVEPTLDFIPTEPRDLFMLCSDGLTNYVSNQEIAHTLTTTTSLNKKGRQLVDLANEHGGGDNTTLVLIDIGDDLSR